MKITFSSKKKKKKIDTTLAIAISIVFSIHFYRLLGNILIS